MNSDIQKIVAPVREQLAAAARSGDVKAAQRVLMSVMLAFEKHSLADK
jgi:hypothetical protein